MALTQRLGHRVAPLHRYVDGVIAMRKAGTYHKYVVWHAQVVNRLDPSDATGLRNGAHRGPAFLPWHREFIWRFEQDLQAALGIQFGLPYWNWALDRTEGTLATSRVWTEIGANTGDIAIGNSVWTRMSATFVLLQSKYLPLDLNAPARREFNGFSNLFFGHVQHVQDQESADAFMSGTDLTYDAPNWDMFSSGFRNRNEGSFHDHVHVLVGGDTGDMTIPVIACNDPILFLHHAMVDRLWARWQDAMLEAGVSLADQYRPTMSEASGIQTGHRIDEPMWPWNDRTEMGRWGLPVEEITPRDVLDIRGPRLNYIYDDQAPEGCLAPAERAIRRLAPIWGQRIRRRKG